MMLRRAVVASLRPHRLLRARPEEGGGLPPRRTRSASPTSTRSTSPCCQSAQPVPLPQPVNPDILLGAVGAAAAGDGVPGAAHRARRGQEHPRGGEGPGLRAGRPVHRLRREPVARGPGLCAEGRGGAGSAGGLPKGSALVFAEAEFTHEQGRSIAVTLGTDVGARTTRVRCAWASPSGATATRASRRRFLPRSWLTSSWRRGSDSRPR